MRSWRTILAAVVGLATAAAIIVHRHDIASASTALGGVSITGVAGLVLVTTVTVAVAGWSVAALHPGLTLAQSVMVHQATMAASNTVVASGPVSLALRISMLRSWSLSDHRIATSIVASNIASSFRLWLMTLFVAILGMAGAAPEILSGWFAALITGVAVVVITVSALWWWAVLRHPRMARALARGGQRVLSWLHRRWSRIPEIDLDAAVAACHDEARSLVRYRGRAIAMSSGVELVVVVITPVVVARILGVEASVVSTSEIIVAFAMVRLASAMSPLPGGIGVAEVGTVLLLGRLGVSEDLALATMVIHRMITFVTPLILGGCCLVHWHRFVARRTLRDSDRQPRSTVLSSDESSGSTATPAGLGSAP